MFAFGARKLMIPSTVVQTVQTSAMVVDVIASFRNIFGSKELTVSCLEGRSCRATGTI